MIEWQEGKTQWEISAKCPFADNLILRILPSCDFKKKPYKFYGELKVLCYCDEPFLVEVEASTLEKCKTKLIKQTQNYARNLLDWTQE